MTLTTEISALNTAYCNIYHIQRCTKPRCDICIKYLEQTSDILIQTIASLKQKKEIEP